MTRFIACATNTISESLGTESQLQETKAFKDLAAALFLVSELKDWEQSEKDLLNRIIVAKCSESESRYLRLMQQHQRLRKAFVDLGSG